MIKGVSEELLAAILARLPAPLAAYGGQDVARVLARELERYGKISDGLREQDRQVSAVAGEYEQKMRQIEARRGELRAVCDHPVWEENGDPSGGGDSFSRCRVCGQER